MSRRIIYLILVVASLLIIGCQRVRAVVAVDVKDIGPVIKTRYRYCCTDSKDQESLKSAQPYVFSDDGIPVGVSCAVEQEESWTKWLPSGWGFTIIKNWDKVKELISSKNNGFEEIMGYIVLPPVVTAILFSAITSSFVFPDIESIEIDATSHIIVDDNQNIKSDFRLYSRFDVALSAFTPYALLFYNDNPNIPLEFKNCVVKTAEDSETYYKFFMDLSAYAIAVKLKELEDSGAMDGVSAKWEVRKKQLAKQKEEQKRKEKEAERQELERKLREESAIKKFQDDHKDNRGEGRDINKRTTEVAPRQQTPVKYPPLEAKYSLELLKWDEDDDFACKFRIKMKDDCTIEAFSKIRRTFVNEIMDVYLQMHPSADGNSLRIDARPNLENGKIVGRAVILTIKPVSLVYDAYSRRGTLSIHFGYGQYAEARRWAVENIETLVRDKNIIRVTGEQPPPGQYMSLGERCNDNILEIDLKAE